jgi:multiple antibiotic resistance protein
MSIFAMVFSLFFVLNSLGSVPLFVGVLSKFEVKRQRQIIFRELLIALLILLLFNFFGDNALKLLGISQPVLGVAGGTLLFIIALGMIFPRPMDALEAKRSEPMIVPLAIPLVAGPGAITTVLVYAEQVQNVWMMSSIIFLAWIPTFVILLLSSNIKYFLGKKGLMACQKLGGMLISLIAVQMICTGVTYVLRDALYLPHKELTLEPIAKLPAPEKSMILGQFVGVATRPELRRQGHTRESRTWQRSGKMAKKSDFAGAGSFAIPSNT